jgi:xylulokinase
LRAAFFNLAAGTTPAELVRAVFEGVAYNTRWLLGAVERFTGRRLDPLTLVGGGGNSPGWAQIIADVLGRTIARAAEPSAVNLRGAGLLGALALGRIEQEDVAAAVPVAEIHRPDPRTAGLHDDRFGEFLAFYRSSRGGFGVRRRRPSSSRM